MDYTHLEQSERIYIEFNNKNKNKNKRKTTEESAADKNVK